jgi:hypothetical protein
MINQLCAAGLRIGPEDRPLIAVWKNEALSQKQSVRPGGKITLAVRIRQAMREAAAELKVLKEEGARVLAWLVTRGASARRGL